MKTITAIIDIDGICFDWTERLRRCTKADGTIDWDKAFINEEVEQDPVIEGAPEAVRRIWEAGFKIVYLTSRSKKCLQATWRALRKADFPLYFPPDILAEMRDYNDIRPDAEVKQERIRWLKMLPLNETLKYYDFVAAIDDDYNGTLKPMYEALGIPCFLSFDEFFRSEIWWDKCKFTEKNGE